MACKQLLKHLLILALVAGFLFASVAFLHRFEQAQQWVSSAFNYEEAGTVVEVNAKKTSSRSWGRTNTSAVREGLQLKLCDCERATGPPNALGCDKQGWFISDFQNSGTWVGGGGLVPLSPAVCCRPCLDNPTPQLVDTLGGDSQVVAIISRGCHLSSGYGPQALKCEPDGASFIKGFSASERVSNYYYDYFYPLSSAECCSPAVLLSNGDMWKLERCDCVQVNGKECGAASTQRMLWGFQSWRVSHMGDYVPVAPMACCGVCLGEQVKDPGNCEDLHGCSGQGICSFGACECFPGYWGADCSSQVGGGDAGALPWWAVLLIIMGSFMVLSAASVAVRTAYLAMRLRLMDNISGRGQTATGEVTAPLLVTVLDDGGSAGSRDSSDAGTEAGEGDDDEGEWEEVDPDEVAEMTAAAATTQSSALSAALERSPGTPNRRQVSLDCNATQESEVDGDVACNSANSLPGSMKHAGELWQADSLAKSEGGLLGYADHTPLPGICAICFSAPCQVALVPCGHANLCRKCSRRCDKCPFCRKQILRRQRVYCSASDTLP